MISSKDRNNTGIKKVGNKRVFACILAIVMVVSTTLPILASTDDENTSKQEVIYCNLNADGSVDIIKVVNIFSLDEDSKVTDYGNYLELRNMTSSDPINYSEETIEIDTKEGMLYYEGLYTSNEMPWHIDIVYLMDNIEYTADEIAGMSGALEIRMTIEENKALNTTFFENYALQVAVTLDNELNSNIHAAGATVAEVGSDKQLSYIILPNSEKAISITADVVSFEMEPIEIVGLLLNITDSLEFDADSIDMSEYESMLIDLQEAAVDLDKGGNDLFDGASDLKEGVSQLVDASEELSEGVNNLDEGAVELVSGVSDLNTGLIELKSNNTSLLTGANEIAHAVFESSTQQLRSQLIAAGMSEMDATQIILTMDNYVTVIEELTGGAPSESQIVAAETMIRDQLTAMGLVDTQQQNVAMTLAEGYLSEGTATNVEEALAMAGNLLADSLTNQVSAEIVASTVANDENIIGISIAAIQEQTAGETEALVALKNQLDSVVAFVTGLNVYTSSVEEATAGSEQLMFGTSEFAGGVSLLASGATDLVAGVAEVKGGSGELLEGAQILIDGTGELSTEVDKIDTDIAGVVQEKIDVVMSEYGNADFIPVSFVSEKNTNVESVQFVIQTETIEVIEEELEVVEVDEKKSFWEKLLALFGL